MHFVKCLAFLRIWGVQSKLNISTEEPFERYIQNDKGLVEYMDHETALAFHTSTSSDIIYVKCYTESPSTESPNIRRSKMDPLDCLLTSGSSQSTLVVSKTYTILQRVFFPFVE